MHNSRFTFLLLIVVFSFFSIASCAQPGVDRKSVHRGGSAVLGATGAQSRRDAAPTAPATGRSYDQGPQPDLRQNYINRINSCLLGSWNYSISTLGEDAIHIIDSSEEQNTEVTIKLYAGEANKSKITEDLHVIHNEKNKYCIEKVVLELIKLYSEIKNNSPGRRSQSKTDFSLSLEKLPYIASEPSESRLNVLKKQHEKNLEDQAFSCQASPTICYRDVYVGQLLEARIAGEQRKLSESNSHIELSVINAILVEYLNARYKEGVVIEDRPGYVFYKPKIKKGMVLFWYKFWEELEIKIVSSLHDNQLSFTVIVDGRYAAGVKPPYSKSDYIDFEIGFSKEIDEYARSLAQSIRKFLVDTQQQYAYRFSDWNRLIEK